MGNIIKKQNGKNLKGHENIERSLITTYKKTIWNKFIGAIKEYGLIKKGDKIAVCLSGGKDSWVLAKLMENLQKYSEYNFQVFYITMDPGYDEKNKKQILKNKDIFNIDLDIFKTEIFKIVKNTEKTPCYLCARMRRGYLYKKAQELGCNKIALGHHFDDVIETNLMSMIYGAQIRTMMPKVKSMNFKEMELIRPLYLVEEKQIINWQRYNNLEFIKCGCPLNRKKDGENTKRDLIKSLIKSLSEDNFQIRKNIFRSMENVNLETVIAYEENNSITSFLEKY